MVGKRLVHRLWYKFLSWLISNTFSHSFSVIWLFMLSAVCSSSLISLPPNCNKRKHTLIIDHQGCLELYLPLLGETKLVFMEMHLPLACVGLSLTRGLVGATLQARKASL